MSFDLESWRSEVHALLKHHGMALLNQSSSAGDGTLAAIVLWPLFNAVMEMNEIDSIIQLLHTFLPPECVEVLNLELGYWLQEETLPGPETLAVRVAQKVATEPIWFQITYNILERLVLLREQSRDAATSESMLMSAWLSGIGNIAMGEGATVTGDRSVIVGKDLHGSIYIGDVIHGVDPDENFRRVVRDYLVAVQDSYVDYWERHVSQDRHGEMLPVGQSFTSDSLYRLTSVSRTDTFNEVEDKDETHSEGTSEGVQIERVRSSKQEPKESPEHRTRHFTALREVLEAMQQLQKTGAILLGEPGAGKTLSLRHIAAEQATRVADGSTGYLPIYAPLNLYKDDMNLKELIKVSLTVEDVPPAYHALARHVEHIISSSRLLLLLDGLNEISEASTGAAKQQRRFMSLIGSFTKSHNLMYLVSSRETHLTASLDLPKIYLQPFDYEQIAACIELYTPHHKEELLTLLSSSPSLTKMVSNPYRARVLAQLYRPGDPLPQTAGTLFARLVQESVAREELRYHERKRQWKSFEEWQSTLYEVAHSLRSRAATAILASELPAAVDTGLLDYARHCGFLLPSTGTIEFNHQQLQEFFAACWLKERMEGHPEEDLSSYIISARWEEAILLLIDIISDDRREQLVAHIAGWNPLLAARCIGIAPERVSKELRQWLAAWFRRSLSSPVGQRPTIRRWVFQALGEMRCGESLEILTNTPVGDNQRLPRSETTKIYYQAIAAIDNDDAARFIAAQLCQEAVKSEWRGDSDWSPFFNALVSMRTPYARHFLARTLYYRPLLDNAREAVAHGGVREALPALRDLLSTNVSAAADIAIQGNFQEMIPALLPYSRQNMAALQALVALGAGQQVIDSTARYYRAYNRYRQQVRDFNLLHRDNKYLIYSYFETWYGIREQLGPIAAEQFLEFLGWVAEHSASYTDRYEALLFLTILRHPRSSEITDRFSLKGTSNDYDKDPDQKKLIDFIRDARQLSHIGIPPGSSKRTAERFIASLASNIDLPEGFVFPEKRIDRLNQAWREPQQIAVLARHMLPQPGSLSRTELITTLAVLVENAAADAGRILVEALIELASTPEYGWRDNYQRGWHIVELLIEHGEKGEAQRQELFGLLDPLVFSSSLQLQTQALHVLSVLGADELVISWLDLLNNATWPVAYVVIDALYQMNPPESTREALRHRLWSPLADERYFAALALGALADTSSVSEFLKLYNEKDPHVLAAIVIALGEIGHASSEVIKFFRVAVKNKHGRVRLEVARAAGVMNAHAFLPDLLDLLHDSDRRVVLASAESLGWLGDPVALSGLEELLPTCQENGWHMAPPHQAETRLAAIVAAALAKCGSSPDYLIKNVRDERVLRPILAGYATFRKPERPRASDTDTYPNPEELDYNLESELEKLGTLSSGDLLRSAWNHPYPQVRSRAFIQLSNTDMEDLWELEHRLLNDPSPAVRQAIRRHSFKPDSRTEVQFRPNSIHEDLQWAQQHAVDDSQMTIRLTWGHEVAPLSLAAFLPDAFDLHSLQQALLEKWGVDSLNEEERDLLLRTIDKGMELQRTLRRWRQTLPAPGSWRTDHDHYFSLAKRRIWSIVPELLAALQGEETVVLHAASALCELGVYQAAGTVDLALARCREASEHASTRMRLRITEFMVKIELAGLGPVIDLSDISDEEWRYDQIIVLVLNFLCELSTDRLPEQWSELYSRSDSNFVLLLRGIRKWGLPAFVEVVRAIAPDVRPDDHILRQLLVAASDPKEEEELSKYSFRSIGYYLLQERQRYPDECFVAWLEDDCWLLQLVGAYVLAGRNSTLPLLQLEQLLRSKDARVLLGLLYAADKGIAPQLTHALQGLQENEVTADVLQRELQNNIARHLLTAPAAEQNALLEFVTKAHLTCFTDEVAQLIQREDDTVASTAIETVVRWYRNRVYETAFYPLLQSVAVSAEGTIAAAAIFALGRGGRRDVARLLVHRLEDKDSRVVAATLVVMGLLRYRPVAEKVMAFLDAPQKEVQEAAVIACTLLRLHNAIPRVEAKLQQAVTLEDSPKELETSPVIIKDHYLLQDCLQFLKEGLTARFLGREPTSNLPYEDSIVGLALACEVLSTRNKGITPYSDTFLIRGQYYPVSLLIKRYGMFAVYLHIIRKGLRNASWISRALQRIILATIELAWAHGLEEDPAQRRFLGVPDLGDAKRNLLESLGDGESEEWAIDAIRELAKDGSIALEAELREQHLRLKNSIDAKSPADISALLERLDKSESARDSLEWQTLLFHSVTHLISIKGDEEAAGNMPLQLQENLLDLLVSVLWGSEDNELIDVQNGQGMQRFLADLRRILGVRLLRDFLLEWEDRTVTFLEMISERAWTNPAASTDLRAQQSNFYAIILDEEPVDRKAPLDFEADKANPIKDYFVPF